MYIAEVSTKVIGRGLFVTFTLYIYCSLLKSRQTDRQLSHHHHHQYF